MNYQRNGRVAQKPENNTVRENQAIPPQKGEEKIKVDGFGQVIALLRHADPEFRQSLLRRLTQQDPKMGAALAAALRKDEN